MDLGIKGKKALVCGASKGLGRGCAEALAEEGVNLTILARTREDIERAADELRARWGVAVTAIACDITQSKGRDEVLAICGDPDILVTNSGGPPTGDSRKFTDEQWLKALNDAMLSPIDLIRRTVDGMATRGFGRIVNITSWMVKAPADAYGLSTGPRLGLTGFSSGLARTVAAHNVTINNLLPGVFETERIDSTIAVHAQHLGVAVSELIEKERQLIPARRMGSPKEFGAACAFLCSAQAGYIVGQNVLLDGGRYTGLF